VKSGAKVWYIDRQQSNELGAHYSDLPAEVIEPDVVADAADLPFEAGMLDFIIASHVLEHLPFPLAALENWYRHLAPRGTLLLRIPDMRFTFDAKRARTALGHLLEEHSNRTRFDRRAHFMDWLQGVSDCRPGTPEFEQELRRLLEMDYSIHYHVWTTDDVRELLEHTQKGMKLRWQPRVFWGAHFYRKEIVVLLQRTG
jgi:predicted SAM-dependent methyltransferase